MILQRRAWILVAMVGCLLVALVFTVNSDRRAPAMLGAAIDDTTRVDDGVRLERRSVVLAFSIGDSAASLDRLAGVAVSTDGRVAAVRGSDGQILFVAPGERLARLAKSRSLISTPEPHVGWQADTLWIWDQTRKQLGLFDTTGRRVASRNVSWAFSAPRDFGRHPSIVGNVAIIAKVDDDYLVFGDPGPLPLPPGWTHRRPLYRIGRHGLIHRIVGDFPATADSGVLILDVPGVTDSLPLPCQAHPVLTIANDGSRIGYMRTDADENGVGRANLVVLTSNGDTILARDYRFSGTPLPDSTRTRIVTAWAAPLPVDIRDSLRQIASRKCARFLPPVSALVFQRGGNLWLGLRESGGDRTWMVLNATGDPLEYITLPANVDVVAATRLMVWGTTSDGSRSRILNFTIARN